MHPGNDVLAIVVTHNRLELLKRCIRHLQAQEVRPDILIINNQSTDGTEDFLKTSGVDFVTQENSGSAGGWSRGIKEGWERNYKFVWMMDDDGFADPQALKNLLRCWTDDAICISSLVVKENKPEELVFGMPRMNRRNFPVIFARKRKFLTVAELGAAGTKYPYAHLFNGALISLHAIRQVGNVDRSYFMFGDEVDYYFRMRKVGAIYSAVDARHYHPDVSNRTIDKKKVYYFIRNTIILNHLYFDRALIRDFFTVGVALFRILRRNGFGQLLSYFFGTNGKYFYRGIWDGFRGKRINRY